MKSVSFEINSDIEHFVFSNFKILHSCWSYSPNILLIKPTFNSNCSVGPVLDAANCCTKVLGSDTPLSLDHQRHTKRIQAIYLRFSMVYVHW